VKDVTTSENFIIAVQFILRICGEEQTLFSVGNMTKINYGIFAENMANTSRELKNEI
jgi:hypothetical protein